MWRCHIKERPWSQLQSWIVRHTCQSPWPPNHVLHAVLQHKMSAGALSQAGSRLHDAAAVLSGAQGVGRWRLLHAQLVARRNRLVSQLADAYQVTCCVIYGVSWVCVMLCDAGGCAAGMKAAAACSAGSQAQQPG
jgi:hypothetical protein